jgi:hypothetical protein
LSIKPKFNRGDKVNVRGIKGSLSVHWPMVIPVPRIIDGQFQLVDEVMYKFTIGKEYCYAYEADVNAAV